MINISASEEEYQQDISEQQTTRRSGGLVSDAIAVARGRLLMWLLATCGPYILLLLLVLGIAMAFAGSQAASCGGSGISTAGGQPTAAAVSQIPNSPYPLIQIYQAAQAKYGIPWNWLAAINKEETDFGRNLSTSSAGAIGWMQFLPSTWAQYGVDGNGDGAKDPYNPWDAIFSAANYLHASGGPADMHAAVLAYNHAEWYYQAVKGFADSYAQGGTQQAVSFNISGGNSTIPAGGMDVVATDFTDPTGAYTSNLVGAWSYAELGSSNGQGGTATRLGGLAPHTKLAITYNGRTVIAEKGDFGGDLNNASIDLDSTIKSYFSFPGKWTVHVQLVDSSMPLGPYNGTVLASGGSSGTFANCSSITGGLIGNASAQAIATAADQLNAMHLPYAWGGGHASTPAKPSPDINGATGPDGKVLIGLDCSGAVSWVLQHAGFRLSTMDSTGFMSWGDRGPGKYVTIFANAGHVFMKIGNRYFGTSGFGHPAAGTGAAWFTSPPDSSYLSTFVWRHPPGL